MGLAPLLLCFHCAMGGTHAARVVRVPYFDCYNCGSGVISVEYSLKPQLQTVSVL